MTKASNISFFELTILILSIYVIIVMGYQFFFPVPDELDELLWIIDNCICTVFIIDFLVNLKKSENKLTYLKYGWIDLLASIPTIGILRVGRIAKIIRIVRIIKASQSIHKALSETFKNKVEGVFKSSVLLSVLLIIASSISILYFERNNTEINTADDSFWWTLYTLTGMDYCSPPISFAGKAIAVFLSTAGMTLLGSFTAFLASLFLNNKNNTDGL
ncbi:MAG: ion transporter [Phocaeicola sp.]